MFVQNYVCQKPCPTVKAKMKGSSKVLFFLPSLSPSSANGVIPGREDHWRPSPELSNVHRTGCADHMMDD
ncbi:hypothetical protein ACRRTK_021571 [Alexandromys fortis]